MKKYFYITLPLLLFLLFSCHQDQYFLFYHFPSKEITSNSRAYRALMSGLRVFTVKNFKEKLIGMVGAVRYDRDSVMVDVMLDRKIPVGSDVKLFICKQPNIVIEDSKAKKRYRPGEIVRGNITLEKLCQ